MRMRVSWIIWGIAAGLAWMAFRFDGAAAQTGPHPTPTPEVMATITDRLAPPPTVESPKQADQGAQVYYLVCMVCHGDRGQGLTEEFRNLLGPPDNNCWSSGCHNASHPPEGFVLPKAVPAVVGPHIPARFANAQELHDFLREKMPWQAPGMLSDEEYWQLTAFVMRLNGRDPGTVALDETNASRFTWQAESAQPGTWRTPAILVVAGLGLSGIVWIVVVRARRRLSKGQSSAE